MTEFELIKIIRKSAGKTSLPVVLGIGDDCAAVKLDRGEISLHTTDCMVEGVHFRREWCEPGDIGWKAVAVNLSDIASMGGRPVGFLMTLIIPRNTSEKFVEKLVKGAISCGKKYGAPLIGGNISSINGPLVVDISMIGRVPEKHLLKRSGARNGDLIFISGNPGCSSAGLKILESGDPKLRNEYKKLIQAHLRPAPRLELASRLADNRLVNSMIDVSDGLVQDLGHICEESGIDADLNFGEFEPAPQLKKFCLENEIDLLQLMENGGEDYEILFTANPRNKKRIKAIASGMNVPLTEIGTIVARGRGIAVDKNANGFSHKLF